MATRPIKFGYTVEAPVEWPELLEVARTLDERTGFDYLWIADSLLPNGPPDAPKLEAFTALAAIAQATSRLRLGLLVAGNAYRHPAMTAKIVTTLDHISGGRVELGMGAGWPGDHRRFGIDFWTRRERYERFDEALQVIKLLWTQPKPSFAGRYYQLDEPPYQPGNVQQPHPPILIGGGSEPMLRIMARHADAVSPMIDAKEAFARIDALCREIGRDPASIRRTNGGMLFLNDDAEAQRRAVAYAAATWKVDDAEVRQRGLFGSAEDVRQAVRRQIDDGAQEIHIFQLPRVHLKSVLRFSDEVIPAFR